MITNEKIAAIKKQLRSGVPEGEIKNDLISEGYLKEDIDKAFAPHKYNMRSGYLISGIILFIAWLYSGGDTSLIIFSAAMFSLYYVETQRKLKEKENG